MNFLRTVSLLDQQRGQQHFFFFSSFVVYFSSHEKEAGNLKLVQCDGTLERTGQSFQASWIDIKFVKNSNNFSLRQQQNSVSVIISLIVKFIRKTSRMPQFDSNPRGLEFGIWGFLSLGNLLTLPTVPRQNKNNTRKNHLIIYSVWSLWFQFNSILEYLFNIVPKFSTWH